MASIILFIGIFVIFIITYYSQVTNEAFCLSVVMLQPIGQSILVGFECPRFASYIQFVSQVYFTLTIKVKWNT